MEQNEPIDLSLSSKINQIDEKNSLDQVQNHVLSNRLSIVPFVLIMYLRFLLLIYTYPNSLSTIHC